ncbi:YceI family protein [Cryobacterium tagatosivorans]|uniref:Polyisoprenoid-binding protein n=1 Tax=Cryobacterium tagatosivorans TaxID=1259199 RepID=A0A4R8UGM5_9MICO|nr:YceI family protein [Cryobacterium tagatosivorans]TFB53093.1 polyisoprenoid-binding protein [Cryobacterium tagatosivorans]
MSDVTPTNIPGYKAGTWTIDPTHSEVGFSIRHIMISKVKGTFDSFDATFVTGENPLDSTVTATAQVASINTNEANRDGHLRTGDFFDAETYPTIGFVSTGVRQDKGDFLVDGDLTIKGVTKPVTFDFEFGGFAVDPYGNYKAGATAKTQVERDAFGLTYNAALETGGFLLGDKVTITLELQAVLQQD